MPFSVVDLHELLSFLDDLVCVESFADIESVALPAIAILLRATLVIHSSVHVTGSVRVQSYWPGKMDSGDSDDTRVAATAAELLMGPIDGNQSTQSLHPSSIYEYMAQAGIMRTVVCGRPDHLAMVVGISPVCVETLSLVCNDGRFGEREREMATRLTPHLVAAISRAHHRFQLDVPRLPVQAPHQSAAAGLSRREHEVIELVSAGMTAAQVARRFGISPRTVDKHLENVYRKLAVKGRVAAVERLSADAAWG